MSWRVPQKEHERVSETEVFPSLDHVSGTLCLSHYVTETSHLYSLRDFWRHFGLCKAAAHSDCCFFAPCTIGCLLTYFLASRRMTIISSAVDAQDDFELDPYCVTKMLWRRPLTCLPGHLCFHQATVTKSYKEWKEISVKENFALLHPIHVMVVDWTETRLTAVFSERVRYMLSPVRLSVVCLSVCRL